MTPWSIDALRQQAQDIAAAFRFREPPINLEIGWSDDYDRLFQSEVSGVTAPDSILDQSLQHGRILLQSEGGSGKSTVLKRLFIHALERDLTPTLIDLRIWSTETFDEWTLAQGNDTLRAAILLETLAQPPIGESVFTFSADDRFVVLVDGLNELPSAVADEIIRTLDSLARRNPNVGVVASDRIVRRRLHGEGWLLATIEPISTDEAERVLDRPVEEAEHELFQTAFFLDLAQREGIDATSSSRTLADFFVQHAGVEHDHLSSIAAAAFEMYAATETRRFPIDQFAGRVSKEDVAALRASGALVVDGDAAYFSHHLFHDFLASVHLARHPELWNDESFDVITFKAGSFDALALTLEQVEDRANADELVRRIYDWNFHASSYAVAKSRVLGELAVSDDLELALVAMLAERRWDPIVPTAQRVTDALRFFHTELADSFLAAESFAAAQELVEQSEVSDAYERWQQLYVRPEGDVAEDSVVGELQSEDSFVGWAAANALKRMVVNEELTRVLRALLHESEDETIRWRASHALGAHPGEDTVQSLFRAMLDDPYHWVRYGAVRSLVEAAAQRSDLRDPVFEELRTVISDVASKDPRTVQEFERALVLRQPPSGWAEAVAPVLEELLVGASTLEEQDHWREVAYRVQRAVEGAYARQ